MVYFNRNLALQLDSYNLKPKVEPIRDCSNNPISYIDPDGHSAVSVRDSAKGSKITVSAGVKTINIGNKTLTRGKDYYVAKDGRAYYYNNSSSSESSPSKSSAAIKSTNKSTNKISEKLDNISAKIKDVTKTMSTATDIMNIFTKSNDVTRGINQGIGIIEQASSSTTALIDTAAHPIKTGKDIASMFEVNGLTITLKPEVVDSILNSIGESWDTYKNADADTRARIEGRFQLAVSETLAPAGALGMLKGKKVIDKLDDIAGISKGAGKTVFKNIDEGLNLLQLQQNTWKIQADSFRRRHYRMQ